MSEMVKRVARALANSDPEFDPEWDYTEQARSAIEAMMEPTPKMLGEAAKAMSPGKRPTPEFVSVKEKHRIRYQAMIRSALEE